MSINCKNTEPPYCNYFKFVYNYGMKLYDFKKYKVSTKFYGGSETKLGIMMGDQIYMLKFPKNTTFGVRNNVVSEYIGSHIYELLNIEVQETLLGTYGKEFVVACKDFTQKGHRFVPFNDVSESTIETDKESYQYTYKDILVLLNKNKKLTNIEDTVSAFFDIYIVDALIGNFDRHGANWGFLKKDDKYILAPVFDNGSSLYPSMIDEKEMLDVINNEEEINKRVYEYPLSQIKIGNKKSSYFDVISSLKFDEINKSLIKIYEKIDMKKIEELIDDIHIISDTQKLFYKTLLKARYEKIIKYSYLKLMGKVE